MDSTYLENRVPLSAKSLFKKMNIDFSTNSIENSLNKTKIERRVLQEFCPLAQSLEWELASLSWDEQGVLPFADNAVPFIITNSGRLSEHSAAVLFESCKQNPPTSSFSVMELGAGSGLFARLFLDTFKKICEQEKTNYYSLLNYIVSDASERSIEQWRERGVFEDHEKHVQALLCDASNADTFSTIKKQSLRALFCNYVLDVLPSSIVRKDASQVEELNIRTHLHGNASVVSQHTNLSYKQIVALASSDDRAQRCKLLPLVTLLELETKFQPISSQLSEKALKAINLQSQLEKIVFNYGAISCLEACTELLEKNGFILINDYGPVNTGDVEKQVVSQRFGPTVALGINFPLIDKYFSSNRWNTVIPDNDAEAPIHTRLMYRAGELAPTDMFHNRFGSEGHAFFEQPVADAREHAQAGRKNDALESYKEALTRNQGDWFFLGEVAEYVGLQLSDWPAGIELVQEAIKLNPWYSAWLWNVLGDCLFCQNRNEDAHEAYLQAQRIAPSDARTSLNLAYTYTAFLRFDEALFSIAQGLSQDKEGLLREQLLEKQREILSQLSNRALGEQERLMRRAVSQQ